MTAGRRRRCAQRQRNLLARDGGARLLRQRSARLAGLPGRIPPHVPIIMQARSAGRRAPGLHDELLPASVCTCESRDRRTASRPVCSMCRGSARAVDRHQHVPCQRPRSIFPAPGASDAEQLAVGADQRRATPLGCAGACRALVEHVFPVAGTALGETRGFSGARGRRAGTQFSPMRQDAVVPRSMARAPAAERCTRPKPVAWS